MMQKGALDKTRGPPPTSAMIAVIRVQATPTVTEIYRRLHCEYPEFDVNKILVFYCHWVYRHVPNVIHRMPELQSFNLGFVSDELEAFSRAFYDKIELYTLTASPSLTPCTSHGNLSISACTVYSRLMIIRFRIYAPKLRFHEREAGWLTPRSWL